MDFTPLEMDEDYKGLSYAQQLKTRAIYADTLLNESDEEYRTLAPESKAYVLNELSFSTPSFKDDKLNQTIKQMDERIKGDEKKAGFSDWVVQYYGQEEARKKSLIASFLTKMVDVTSTTLDKFVFDPKDEIFTIEEARMNPEQDKIRDYIYETIKRNPEKYKQGVDIMNGFANTEMGLEVISAFGKFAGSTFNPKGIAKPVIDTLNNWISKSTLQTTKSLLTMAKPVAHAGVTTAMGAARELTKEVLNELGSENFDAQKSILELNSKLGGYFAFDIAANLVLDILIPTGWALGKIYKGGWDVGAKESAKTALESVLTGKTISQTLVDRLPEIKKNTEYIQNYFAVLKNTDKLTATNLAKATGLSFGFKVADDGSLLKVGLKGKKGFDFKGSPEDALKYMKNKLLEASTFSDKAKVTMGGGKRVFTVQNVIEREIGEDFVGSSPVLTNLLAPVGGKYNKDKLKGFVRTFLKAQDASGGVIKSVNIREIDGVPEVLKKEGVQQIGVLGGERLFGKERKFIIEVNGKPLFTLPESVTSAEMEREIAVKLTKELQLYSRGAKDISGNFVDGYKEQVKAQKLYTPEWVDQAVKGLYPDGKVTYEIGGEVSLLTKGKKETFKDIGELVNTLNRKTLSVDELNFYLKRNYDLNLKQTDDGLVLWNDKKKIVEGEYKSIEDFYDQSGFMTPKLSSTLAPEIFVQDNGVAKIKFIQKASTGQYHHLLKEMDKYLGKIKPWKEIDLSVGGQKRVIQFSDTPAVKSVNIFYPDLNHTESFTSMREARKALAESTSDFENLFSIVGKKGLFLDSIGGKYYVVDSAGQATVFKDEEALKGYIKDIPNNPDFSPEYSGLDDEVVQGIAGNFSYDPKEFVNPKLVQAGKLTPKGVKSELLDNSLLLQTTTLETYLQKAIARGESIDAQKVFYKIRDTRNFIHVEDVKMADFFDKVFTSGGKRIKKKTMEKMVQLLEAKTDVEREAIRVQLKPEEIEATSLIRKFYGESEGEGVYKKYASEFADFRQNYASKIRQWYAKKENQELAKELTPKEFFKQVFPETLASKGSAFFVHSRVHDVVDIANDMDLQSSLLKYGKVANRQKYLAPVWEEMGSLLQKDKNISTMTKMRMMNYQGEVMKTFKLPVEKITEESVSSFLKSLSEGEVGARFTPKDIENLSKIAIGWHYSSLMGFKAFLPLRNMLQPWSTIAPVLGNTAVIKAHKLLMNDVSGSYFKHLKEHGVIRGQVQLFEDEAFATGMLEKYFQGGLKWFKNSDDWTRAVGAVSSYVKFDEAWEAYLKSGKKLPKEVFLKESGVKWLAASRQMQVMDMLNQGNVKGARDLFASDMVDSGLFRYQSGENIPLFTNYGAVGRVFGRFGTYSVQYVSYLRNILAKSSIDEKIAFGTRLTGNSLLMVGAFKALGINASSLMFYNPIFFTGSPTFDFLYTAMKSFDQSFEGDINRGKLAKEAYNVFIPGIATNMFKGLDSINKGSSPSFYFTFNNKSTYLSTISIYLRLR
jgi:hypothetical protein